MSQHGPLWTCKTCSGRYVGLATLRKSGVRDRIMQLWKKIRDGESVEGRDCPSCRNPMREVTETIGETALAIDFCTTCSYVWFDPSEYERMSSVPLDMRKMPDIETDMIREMNETRRLERRMSRAGDVLVHGGSAVLELVILLDDFSW